LHAQSLRSFLTERCHRVLVFDPQQLWFEALQGAVLLLAETKSEQEQHGHGIAIHQTRSDDFLREDPGEFFRGADYANGDTITGKWMPALLSGGERKLIKHAAALPNVYRFREIADADVGIVTGANKFFLVPDETVRQNDLGTWAHPMFGRSEHVPGVIYDQQTHENNRRAGLPANFLWFRGAAREDMPVRARAYLQQGERDGLHERYKCRIRSPWYVVPSVYAAPVAMLKRSHSFPRLILNEAGAFTTDTAYRLRPKPGIDHTALVAGFVNSLTALSAELEGRHYGGGVLELVPSEIERLMIPHVPLTRTDLVALDTSIRSGAEPGEALEMQDARVLVDTGLSLAECDELRGAWLRLKMRRHRSEAAAESDDLD